MDSFELNKIIAAILMVALLIIGIGKLSDVIFYVEKPKTPGYAVEVDEIKTHLNLITKHCHWTEEDGDWKATPEASGWTDIEQSPLGLKIAADAN